MEGNNKVRSFRICVLWRIDDEATFPSANFWHYFEFILVIRCRDIIAFIFSSPNASTSMSIAQVIRSGIHQFTIEIKWFFWAIFAIFLQNFARKCLPANVCYTRNNEDRVANKSLCAHSIDLDARNECARARQKWFILRFASSSFFQMTAVLQKFRNCREQIISNAEDWRQPIAAKLDSSYARCNRFQSMFAIRKYGDCKNISYVQYAQCPLSNVGSDPYHFQF